MRAFYGHFAAAYGTCWLVFLLAALVTRSHIETGPIGFWGFPLVSIVYAFIRVSRSSSPAIKP